MDRRGFRTLLQQLVRPTHLQSEEGAYLGVAGGLQVPRSRIDPVLRKIAKGLYYVDTRQPMPNDVHIEVTYGNPPSKLIEPPFDEVLQGSQRVDFGQGVVTYWRNRVGTDFTASVTWVFFYSDKAFRLLTYRDSHLEASGGGG